MKAGGKQSNRFDEMYDYIGNRRDRRQQDPVNSLVGQNEPPVRIGSDTQPSEPIGYKTRMTSIALKRAGCAGVGKERKKLCVMGWKPGTSCMFG
jgi:hypothetical protein